MYGSYGSYSSQATLGPMDISGGGGRAGGHQDDASCAFPSWPRRASLSASDCEQRATSFLSDEDLFGRDALDDDASSAASSSAGSALASPSDDDLLDLQRDRHAYQRELVRFLMSEKEQQRRRQQQAQQYQAQQQHHHHQHQHHQHQQHPQPQPSRRRRSATANANGSSSAATTSTTATANCRRGSPKSKLGNMTLIAEAGGE